MNFVRYNPAKELPSCGFINLGFTCYYNALIQGLLSATSFVEEIDEVHSSNATVDAISTLIEYIANGDHQRAASLAPETWKVMIRELARQSRELAQFAVGQQCAVEGFNMLLQTMEKEQNIQNLFLHRRINKLYCNQCNKWCSEATETNTFFEVEPDFKLQQLSEFKARHAEANNLNTFLLNQTSYVDNDHVCPLCGYKGNKFKHSQLSMIPEILFVMSKKYKYSGNRGEKLNTYTDFPEFLEFKGKRAVKLRYEAVAQIEHSGSLDGGHYWAVCRRRDGWYRLNDMAVSHAEFKPTNDTYIVIYHVM